MHFFKQISNINYLLCLLAIGIWWGAPLWMIGVFDDGVFYSCIARNLAYDAQAAIWDLKVSNALDNSFNGHPPLAFWLQGIFFWLVGDFYWVERVYSLLCALLTIWLIHKSWRLLNESSSALAIFFFLCVPIVGWCYANNMLENTMTIFGTAAVYVLIKTAKREVYFSFSILLASFLIFCSAMVKGLVGLYPLVTLVLYALVYSKKQLLRAIISSMMLFLLVGIGFGLWCYWDERALQFFKRYVELQLYTSLSGGDSLAANRFFLLQCLLEELLIVGSIIAAGKLLLWKLALRAEPIDKKQVVFWLLLAAAASLPMLISPKQLRFYIVPSMVFYNLGGAVLFYPTFKALEEYFLPFQRLKKAIRILIYLGISICLVYSFLNAKKYARNEDMLPDIFALGATIPAHTEIYLNPKLYTVWNLHAYMYRYFYIDLSTVPKMQRFALFPKNEVFSSEHYEEQPLDLKKYKLYKLK